MESLFLIVFVVISGLASLVEYLGKRKREKQAAEEAARGGLGEPVMRRPEGERQNPLERWERELKRMLEESTQPQPRPQRPHAPQPPPPPLAPARPIITPVLIEPSEGDLVRPSILRQAGAAHARVSNLQKSVENRLAEASHHAEKARRAPMILPSLVSNTALARDITKDRHSLRRAFLAGIILGPPRSTEI